MKTKKIKILNISTIKELRGGDIQMLNIINTLQDDAQFEHCVLIRKNAAIIKYLKQNKVAYFEAPRANNLDVRFVWKIISSVAKKSANIIHVHDSTALTLTLIASYFFPKGVKIIYSRKSNNPIKDKKLNRWKYNHPRISKMVCVSKMVQTVLEKSIVDHSRLLTIYDGISIEKKKTLPLEKIYTQLNNQEVLIGTLAGLTKAKDLFTFIDVAKKVIKSHPHAQFLIFGRGELEQQLKEYSRSTQTENNVHFLGYVENAIQYLPHLQATVITSIREGLPLCIFEAFLMKIPVVSTAVSSIPEIIIDRETGMLAPVKDSDTLALKIIELVENKELVEKITSNAYKLVKEKFTLDIVGHNYKRFYRSIIDSSKTS